METETAGETLSPTKKNDRKIQIRMSPFLTDEDHSYMSCQSVHNQTDDKQFEGLLLTSCPSCPNLRPLHT